MDEQGFTLFIERYYEAPDPARAPEAVDCLISIGNPQSQNAVMSYFFARIAQGHPSTLRGYEQLFTSKPSARAFLLPILGQAGDHETLQFLRSCIEDPNYSQSRNEILSVVDHWSPGRVQPLQQSVGTPYDLDLLWVEFTATGEANAVVAIIDVLERPDIIRERFRAFLHPQQAPGIVSRWRRRRLVKKLADAGILIDLEEPAIASAQDLDCYCNLEAEHFSRERQTRFESLLPFALTEQDVLSIRLKALARWSLGSNAKQHQPVLRICETEGAKRVGRCRISLLDIAAHANLSANDPASALNRLTESLTPEPQEEQRQIESAKRELQAAAGLAKPASHDSPSKKARTCADVTASARSYRAKLTVGALPVGRDTPAVDGIEFNLAYAKPGNSRVSQIIDDDFDEWVTVCGRTFRSPLWFNRHALEAK